MDFWTPLNFSEYHRKEYTFKFRMSLSWILNYGIHKRDIFCYLATQKEYLIILFAGCLEEQSITTARNMTDAQNAKTGGLTIR